MIARVRQIAAQELWSLRPMLQFAIVFSRFLPDLVGNRFRTRAFQAAGVRIGRGTLIGGPLTIAGPGSCHRRVEIGARNWINSGCYFDASDRISLGDDVALGQFVVVLTQSHEFGPHGRRAAALISAPVSIGHGAWIGARSVLLPGVTIGDGAVVGAGSVVTRDVPPDTVAAGVPARVIRELDGSGLDRGAE